MQNNGGQPVNGCSFNRAIRRELSESERRLLEWLLANGCADDADQYVGQMQHAHVVGTCTCGCPSIDLAVGERDERTVGASHILAECEGATPDGIRVHVILHAREGQLSELEVFDIDDVDGPFGLPTVESLRKA